MGLLHGPLPGVLPSPHFHVQNLFSAAVCPHAAGKLTYFPSAWPGRLGEATDLNCVWRPSSRLVGAVTMREAVAVMTPSSGFLHDVRWKEPGVQPRRRVLTGGPGTQRQSAGSSPRERQASALCSVKCVDRGDPPAQLRFPSPKPPQKVVRPFLSFLNGEILTHLAVRREINVRFWWEDRGINE